LGKGKGKGKGHGDGARPLHGFGTVLLGGRARRSPRRGDGIEQERAIRAGTRSCSGADGSDESLRGFGQDLLPG
jgi:hypothetical protein